LSQIRNECQYNHRDLVEATLPAWIFVALSLRRRWYRLKRYRWHALILGSLGLAKRVFLSTRLGRLTIRRNVKNDTTVGSGDVLNLQPGDWVKVRSPDQIFTTLDAEGKNKGLSFTREMLKFCGKEFKVYKRLGRMVLEATGEMRTMRAPTVLLEGVFCDGEFHGGCDRSCFCFWREAWLERTTTPAREGKCLSVHVQT
jgi:hypothetical protein